MPDDNLSLVAQKNALALANAAEVGVGVIANIAGNEIANTLHGETVARDHLSMLMMSHLNELIKNNGKV
jgi:stage III sporulation protein SpoIIIAA